MVIEEERKEREMEGVMSLKVQVEGWNGGG